MLLENINSSRDLKQLPLEQLPTLAAEIRQRMLEVVSRTGGHIASSLGAVELAIALHYCLDTPKDKIIFDVGHQAYAHKILSGRNKEFATLRQGGGISGFPCREESAYDTFTTGHSSSAVSLALGLACARDACPEAGYFKIAAIIGDGSLSGGLCFEGLNNAGHLKKDILVILNTNELSIAPNVGALSTYLNKIISLPIYNRFRHSLDSFVQGRLPEGSRLLRLANKFEESLKGLFIPGMFFEELGFRYFGPFDGHDTSNLIHTLKNILTIKGPRFLHIITKKGKGYPPAENDPVRFHGLGAFDLASGEPRHKRKTPRSYTEVFQDKLAELAKKDARIVAVTAAMPEGTGLAKFRSLYPERFFDVGIAEEHAVCFAGGLARGGLKPVVAVYSTFLQRAYDQIIEDVALQKAGVVFAVDRAGIVGEDGVTHQGIFDLSFLSNIPGMVVMAPKDAAELEAMLEFAIGLGKPAVIRYPKSVAPELPIALKPLQLGKAELLKSGDDFVIVAIGSMVLPALEAWALLEQQGMQGALINARFAKPLDIELLRKACDGKKAVFCVEEGLISGGVGSALENVISLPVIKIGLPDEFILHDKREALLEKYGLTSQGIAGKIKSVLQG